MKKTAQPDAGFQVNEFYEALVMLKRDEPGRFNNLSEATRRAVDHYERAKKAAEKKAA